MCFEFGGGCVSFEFGEVVFILSLEEAVSVLSVVEVVFWVCWRLCFEFGVFSEFGG